MTDRITDRIEIVNADCYTLLDAWPSDAALITDPPYGIGFVQRTTGATIYGDDRPFDPAPFLRFGTVCLWGANCYANRLPDGGSWLVWLKRAVEIAAPKSYGDAELAWCNKSGPVRCKRHISDGCIREGEEHGIVRLHPMQKPVALLAWCLETCGVRDGLVIDPFMGIGSLGVACHRAGLRYLGVEIDPEHYATAKARLQRETAQGLLFMPNKEMSGAVRSISLLGERSHP